MFCGEIIPLLTSKEIRGYKWRKGSKINYNLTGGAGP